MPSSMPPSSPPLSDWFVVSLRPVGQHRPLLRAAEGLGADGVSLSGLRLAAREDTPTRAALDTALRCRHVIFTSPSAVRFAVRLRTLEPAALASRTGQRCFALGQASRTALERAGAKAVEVPDEATSEGLLALPGLKSLKGQSVGLVTAPGGRGILAERLRERGARLAVAEVYARAPARLHRGHVARLLAARGRGAVCVTSAEALHNVLAALPADARGVLLGCVAIASSARLEDRSRDAGFRTVIRAASAAPRALIDALRAHATGQRFR
jgi:uroporphyrinogen-III synthase